MTFQVDGVDVAAAIEVAAVVGSIVAMLIAGLVFYLLVRPPRRRQPPPVREPDALEVEEMIRLLDRMEQRLEVLERAISAGPADERQLLEAGEGPEDRRTK